MADELEMYRLIGDKVRGLIVPGLTEGGFATHWRGEPNIVPVKWYPLSITYVARRVRPEAREGYDLETGIDAFEYQGYVACELLMKDTQQSTPDPDGLVEVESYDAAVTAAEIALTQVLAWGGPRGNMSDDPLLTEDTTERTDSMVIDDVLLGIGDRRGTYSNRASFDFRVYTQKLLDGATWE